MQIPQQSIYDNGFFINVSLIETYFMEAVAFMSLKLFSQSSHRMFGQIIEESLYAYNKLYV